LRQKGSELLGKMRQNGLMIKTIIFGWTTFLKSSLLFFATVYAHENNKESDDFQPTGARLFLSTAFFKGVVANFFGSSELCFQRIVQMCKMPKTLEETTEKTKRNYESINA
jgi:hypothetical protein